MTAKSFPTANAIAAPEVIVIRSHRFACEGVGGALGHPRVWMEMGSDAFVECGYCDRRFVLAGAGVQGESHAPGVIEAGGH